MSKPPLSPEPESGQSKTTVNKGTRNPQKTSFEVILKAQSIRALRGTIQVLQGVLAKLEAELPAGTLPTTAPSKTSGFLGLQMGWRTVLAKIRFLLPENLSSKMSDTALTAIIIGIVMLGVWTTSVLLPSKSAEVASVPPSEQVPAPTITTTPKLTAPPAPQSIENTPEPAPPAPQSIENTPEPAPPAPQSIENTPEPAPPAPQSIENTPEPEMAPTQPLELTPEQNLIASIENQIAEISDRYADGLIQSIQANFQSSRLTIKIGDDWYNLKQSQQDKLAARMLERARELDFTNLEIIDPKGTQLARSPVVGTDMVILKRQGEIHGS